MESWQEKCCTPGVRGVLCNQNAHGHVIRAMLCENFQGNAANQLEHPDQGQALTLTVGPLSVDTLFGESHESRLISNNNFPDLRIIWRFERKSNWTWIGFNWNPYKSLRVGKERPLRVDWFQVKTWPIGRVLEVYKRKINWTGTDFNWNSFLSWDLLDLKRKLCLARVQQWFKINIFGF